MRCGGGGSPTGAAGGAAVRVEQLAACRVETHGRCGVRCRGMLLWTRRGRGVAAGRMYLRSVSLEVPVEELGARHGGCAGGQVELGGGRRVAVEVEGRGAFLANGPHTGAAQLRRQQLVRCFGAANVLYVQPSAGAGGSCGDQAVEQLWMVLVEAGGSPGAEWRT